MRKLANLASEPLRHEGKHHRQIRYGVRERRGCVSQSDLALLQRIERNVVNCREGAGTY